MGLIPTTGTEVSMGRIGVALGVIPNATTQVALNAQLGVGRNRSLSGVLSIPSGSQTEEGASFGGLQTPNTY
jgi:hypothetical protein